MPISPYSLTTTAVPAPSGLSSSARIRVVLPEPRNPVIATTGSRAPRGRFWRRPKSDASLPPKSASGPVSELHFERVEPADMAVDRIDDLALVDEYVVDLDGTTRRPRRRLGDEVPDLLRLVGVGGVVGAQPTVEIRRQDDAVGFPGVRLGQVLIEVVRSVAGAATHEILKRRQRTGRYRYRIGFDAPVDDPDELWPVGTLGAGAFVADDQQVAVEERDDGVGKTEIRRVVVPACHHLWMRHVGDVENDQPAIDIAEI